MVRPWSYDFCNHAVSAASPRIAPCTTQEGNVTIFNAHERCDFSSSSGPLIYVKDVGTRHAFLSCPFEGQQLFSSWVEDLLLVVKSCTLPFCLGVFLFWALWCVLILPSLPLQGNHELRGQFALKQKEI